MLCFCSVFPYAYQDNFYGALSWVLCFLTWQLMLWEKCHFSPVSLLWPGYKWCSTPFIGQISKIQTLSSHFKTPILTSCKKYAKKWILSSPKNIRHLSALQSFSVSHASAAYSVAANSRFQDSWYNREWTDTVPTQKINYIFTICNPSDLPCGLWQTRPISRYGNQRK